MKRVLCAWLPDWPIQRLRSARPELRDRPLVLHETLRGTRHVAACSAEATAMGVRVGMPLAEAAACSARDDRPPLTTGRSPRALNPSAGCARNPRDLGIWGFGDLAVSHPNPASKSLVAGPNVRAIRAKVLPEDSVSQTSAPPLFFPSDPDADRAALLALAQACEKFSPVVGLEEGPSPQCLLLDVTGLAHLFGGEAALAGQVARHFARQGFAVRLCVADTVGAAWAVAREGSGFGGQGSGFGVRGSGKRGEGEEGLEGADLGTDVAGSSLALRIVASGQTAAALGPLPIEALRLPQQGVELLGQLGVRSVGQLEALPREELSVRFGPELLERMDQAAGRLPEPIVACRPLTEFQAQWTGEHPAARQEAVEAAFEHVVRRVAMTLGQAGRGAMRLECRLRCVPGGPAEPREVRFTVGLFEPSDSAGHLFELARMQLERLRLPGPVASIAVEAAVTVPAGGQQQALPFAAGGPAGGSRHLAALVERLSSRLGLRAVVRARLLAEAQPELAWRYDPLVGTSARRRRGGRAAPAGLPPRPLCLLRRPIRLQASSIAPSGPPVRFDFRGRRHQVAETCGPERIETGWWRGRTVGRDYYRVETTAGCRYWLFRRLRDGRWFLHGAFE